MKGFIKKNIKLILGLIIGLLLCFTIAFFGKNVLKSLGIIKSNNYQDNTNLADVASAASSDINYDATASGLTDFNGNTVTKVQDAIDILYAKYGPCTSGYLKTNVSGSGYKCISPSYQLASPYKCKRAVALHTEICNYTSGSSYCYADGYYSGGTENTTTITYGTLGSGTIMTTGDAFDCDVNGNGIIDTDSEGNSTERFYYVSPRWTPGTSMADSTFDTSSDPIYVFIYYKNFLNGTPSDSGAAYTLKADAQAVGSTSTATSQNWWGPVTAKKHLPTTTYWNNVTLVGGTSRTIIACNNANCGTLATSTSGGTLPGNFSYYEYAARLLALPEFIKGCKSINNNTSLSTTGALKKCNFIFEGTKYNDSTKATYGPWYETPYSTSSTVVWYANTTTRSVYSNDTSYTRGARPAIEVRKSQILY